MSGARDSSAAKDAPIGVGVIGLGVMGCTHVRAYASAGAAGLGCRLVAVADRNAERLSGRVGAVGNIEEAGAEELFDPAEVRGYLEPGELLADPAVQAVSICTYTDTHVELGMAALRAGKHVLVEKPIALASADVARLAAAARETGKLCMPAMVMRYWPEWVWLRGAIRDGRYGKVVSAVFQRVGSPPGWSEFYRDTVRSGGALFDLHIHDADFVRWCFGEPARVRSTGSVEHVTTLYEFAEDGGAGIAGGPRHVVAEGGNDLTPGFGFRMRYVVGFERATAEFELGRGAPLAPLVVYEDGRARAMGADVVGSGSGYEAQVRAFVSAIRDGRGEAGLAATIEDAVRTARLLEAEVESLATGSARRCAM